MIVPGVLQRSPYQDPRDLYERPNAGTVPMHGGPASGTPAQVPIAGAPATGAPPASRGGSSFNFSGWTGGAPAPVAPRLSPVNPALAGIGADTSATIDNFLKGVINGGQTRYSDDVVNRLKAEAKSASRGSARAGAEAARYDAITRGTYRSPAENRRIDEAERAADRNYTSSVNQIGFQKANADFEDKMGALDRAQRWLDQLRSYSLGLEGLAADKEKAQAAISLGYARLDQERSALQAQMQMQGAQLGLQTDQFDFYKWLNTVNVGTPNGNSQIPLPLLNLLSGAGGY